MVFYDNIGRKYFVCNCIGIGDIWKRSLFSYLREIKRKGKDLKRDINSIENNGTSHEKDFVQK